MSADNETRVKIDALLQSAIAQHQAGNLAQAQAMYQQILGVVPRHPRALHYLGVLAHQTGHHAHAIDLIGRSLQLEPSSGEANNHMGIALQALGRAADAVPYHERAAKLNPGDPAVLNNLGNALKAVGKQEDAIRCFRDAIALSPHYADAHLNVGGVLQSKGLLDEAEECYRRALEAQPDHPGVHNNIGSLLMLREMYAEAMQRFEKATQLQPTYIDAINNMGSALQAMKEYQRAKQMHERALALAPDHPPTLLQMGHVHESMNQMDEAYAYLEKYAAANSENADAHYALGTVNFARSELRQAIGDYLRAIELDPVHLSAWHNLLFTMNYIPDMQPEDIYRKHAEFGSMAERRCEVILDDALVSADEDRVLTIGYVSGDFREHAVAVFIEPILAHHDRNRFRVNLYANVPNEDAVSRRLKSLADIWRNVVKMSDAELADTIKADAVDILIDLSGHTSGNRLTVFARKPAPVQMTWLGYLNTTGLSRMDYRITDAYAHPHRDSDDRHTERLIRLPSSQWCFRAPEPAAEVGAPPCESEGSIVFGSFNSFFKVNDRVVELWSNILKAVPGSRLMLMLGRDTGAERRTIDKFRSQGIHKDRLELLRFQPMDQYLRLHNRVDIGLDTFPFTGGTVTCYSLWMGVPVITLAGDLAASRGGVSLLNAVGLPELIAYSEREYMDLAINLAHDPGRLRQLRVGLRDKMQSSPVMDEKTFTCDLESAFRDAWIDWCEKHKAI